MALDYTKLPNTKARPSTSLVLYATRADTGKEVKIGAVRKFTRAMSRTNTRRREFDSDLPGETIELMPGLTNTMTLTLSRVVLYKTTMLQELGFGTVEELTEANTGITMYEYRYNKDGTKDIVEYRGCLFTNNPITYDISGTDILMVQDMTLDVTRTILHKGA